MIGSVVVQAIHALQEYVDGHRHSPFDPSRHENGRNTQEVGEPLYAAFHRGNSRHDASIHQPCHTGPFRFLGRCTPAILPVRDIGEILEVYGAVRPGSDNAGLLSIPVRKRTVAYERHRHQ